MEPVGPGGRSMWPASTHLKVN